MIDEGQLLYLFKAPLGPLSKNLGGIHSAHARSSAVHVAVHMNQSL